MIESRKMHGCRTCERGLFFAFNLEDGCCPYCRGMGPALERAREQHDAYWQAVIEQDPDAVEEPVYGTGHYV